MLQAHRGNAILGYFPPENPYHAASYAIEDILGILDANMKGDDSPSTLIFR